ncbi:MAG TPA: glycoside hydrolase family 88 protein [Treponemataceae bacterium]|nr:glycoside hydrolase family 88 protein [Treponemataceae bacterium]
MNLIIFTVGYKSLQPFFSTAEPGTMMIKKTAQETALAMARSVMNRYTPSQMLWHYEHGLVLQSIYAVGNEYNETEFAPWVKSMYDTKIQEDGSILSYKHDEFNLDQINPGKHLFDLYKDSGDKKYLLALDVLRDQLKNHPRTKSSGFWHKKIYPWQMWLDGLYMQGPFYARYASQFGPEEDFDDIVRQIVLAESHTKDKKTGLLYHAWDESHKQLWANPKTGCSPHFWGRAMGWFCMSVLDVLDWIPDTPSQSAHRGTLISIVNSLAQPVMSVQDIKSGLWYQVLDMPNRAHNYLETSASAMFVYFLFKSVRCGYVSSSSELGKRMLQAACEGYRGLLSRVSEDENGNLHLSGICSVAGLGGNPYRDGSYEYYIKEAVVSDDFKGVGPFIYASLEAQRSKLL